MVVGDDPARVGLAAGLAHERGERDRGGVADLTGAELRGRGVDDLVAGRDDGHARAGVSAHVRHARGGQEPEVLRAQRAAGGHELGPLGRVLVGAHEAVPRRRRPDDLDRARHRLLGVLDHDDRVGAVGDHAAGRHRDGGARRDRALRRTPHRDRAGHLEVAGQPLGRAVGVGRPHRVSVDGRAREAREVVRRVHRLGRDAAVRLRQGDGLDGGAPRRPEAGEGLAPPS